MGVELEFEVGNGGWVSYLSCALEKMKPREHAGKRRGRTRELTESQEEGMTRTMASVLLASEGDGIPS